MSRFSLPELIHYCVLGVVLSALIEVGHLSWTECLRLLVIQVGLVFLFYRFGFNSGHGVPDLQGSWILALTLGFVITQFDPESSSLQYRTVEHGLSPFVILASVLGLAAGGPGHRPVSKHPGG